MAAESIGVSIASKVAELLVEPIVRQFRYMCCFNTFVEGLKEEEGNLERKKNEVQSAVNEAKRKTEEIENDVENWLTDTEKVIEGVQHLKREIDEDKRCFSNWFPYCIGRYQLSRRVAKETTKLSNVKEKGEFKKISHQIAPTAIEFLPNKDFMHSSPTKSALDQIIEALKDDNVNMIGLYGVEGVGKTTLAKEVGKHANELKLFDSVLMVVVSKTPDTINLQGQIAGKLGLSLQESSYKDVRAGRLWRRLKSETKILIILDDIWSNFDSKELKDTGIPFREDHTGCKIFLTTRDQSVCNSMGCQRTIKLDELCEDDAWALFKVSAGLDDGSPLKNIAKEVAKRCKGLPQTIVTVGKGLKGKSRNAWDAALTRLKRSKQPNFGDADEDKNAYTRLKSSFDQLNNWETALSFSLRIAIKSVYNGKYLRYVNEESEVHGFLKFSADDDSSALTKFDVEPAWGGKGWVHLKSCYNNQYVMRWSTNHWWMVAQAEEPEEDASKWSCTLFQPKFNDELRTVQFIHVQLGHYACLWRLKEPYGNCLFAGAPHSDQDRCDVYKVFQLDSGEESLAQPV